VQRSQVAHAGLGDGCRDGPLGKSIVPAGHLNPVKTSTVSGVVQMPFTRWANYFVRISSNTSIARGSPDSPSQNSAFFRSAGSEFDLAI
jgi:hypothetical protein